MAVDGASVDPGSLGMLLRQYRDALAHHGRVLREERALVEPRVVALMDVFAGRAAEDFHERWVRSNARLEEDEGRIERLLRLLDAKAADLEDLDHPAEPAGD